MQLAPPDPWTATRDGARHDTCAALAPLEGRIALGSLITRFPRLQLAVPAAEIVRTRGFLMNGLAELPVRLR
jgi:cytochrome P450